MPQFIVFGLDHDPHSMRRRNEVRAEHRAYVRANDQRIRFGAALLDDRENQCGSVYLFDADSEDEVRDWLAREPFVTADVYKQIVVRRIHVARNELPTHDWVSQEIMPTA